MSFTRTAFLLKGRGQGDCIAIAECLVIFLIERGKLLDYLWIDCLLLLGEGRHNKAD